MDLDAGWIERLPRIAYVWRPGDSREAGWPSAGSSVVWRAYARHWSDTTLLAVPYVWRLDEVEVDRGTVNIPAGEHVTIDLDWTWTFDRHVLTFVLDPDAMFDESSEFNNRIDIYTDALGIGFWVEQGLYDFLHETQGHISGIGSRSFEDWSQRQIRLYNQILGMRTYADAPDGVRDRVRLDKVMLLPDGAITNVWAPAPDFTVDASWGFPTRPIDGGLPALQSLVTTNDPTRYYPFVAYPVIFHEMMHQRGLTDLYAYAVFHGTGGNGSWIDIREDGQLVAGSALMPSIASPVPDQIQVYEPPIHGLMDQDFTFVSLHSTLALNLWAGRRTRWASRDGGRIEAAFLDYLMDLPSQNRLTLVDTVGTPLARAVIHVYQDVELENLYGTKYDSVPSLILTADAGGRVVLGRNPFGAGLAPDRSIGLMAKSSTLILRIEHNGRVAYEFLPAYLFNIEFWRGERTLGEYELTVRFRRPP